MTLAIVYVCIAAVSFVLLVAVEYSTKKGDDVARIGTCLVASIIWPASILILIGILIGEVIKKVLGGEL